MIEFEYSALQQKSETPNSIDSNFKKFSLEDLNFEVCFQKYIKKIESEEIGFFDLFSNSHHAKQCQKVFERFKEKKNFIQIGIGGSSLGPEMLVSALGDKKRRFEFINNIDPDYLADQLNGLELSESLFYVASKSGGTAETIAGLSIILSLLKEKGISEDQLNNYIVFVTDPKKSQLLDLAEQLKITCLEIPSNVGGRFSVLTPIGYLPCLFAGISIESLQKGASDIASKLKRYDSDLQKHAEFLINEMRNGVSQTVLMPYSSKLRNFSFWYVQLWAESLGKKLDRNGKIIEIGLTPIPSYGATDQHSQLQLFMEGPRDKVLKLIEVENFHNDFSLSNQIDLPSFKRLEKHKLSDLMHAELNGTKKALKENNRPFIVTKLPLLDEYHMAQLILFYESLTALMGEYFNINAFDQPGVELGKVFAYQFLEEK